MYQGFSAFWRGNWANIFRVIPTLAVRFTLYDKLKRLSPLESFDIMGRLIAGTSSGMLSLFFHYPWDVIRVRMASDMTLFNTSR